MTADRPHRAGPGRRPRSARAPLVASALVAVVIGLLLGRFVFLGGAPETTSPPAASTRSSQAQVTALQARLREAPDDADALGRLGVAYLARGRETADPSYVTKAAEAIDRSVAVDPTSPTTMTAAGLLALTRHDFVTALDWGRRAHAANPDAADPLGVVVDALVELGRYPEAVAAAQEMVDRRPSLAGLARVSYLRQLHGDRAGALAAMTQAVVAGSGSAADVAVAQTLVGDLHLGAGSLAPAEEAYTRALGLVAEHGPAEAGLARVAAARGDLAAARDRLEGLVRRLPEPGSVALLGDVYAALGRPADAAAQYELVRTMEALERASGVAVDLELARFEADHAREPGVNPEQAVELARAALVARPTVFAEDALAWALRQAGRPSEALDHARAATRLGTEDGLLWYHLAVVEADLGMVSEARQHLDHALAVSPFLTVRDLPEARALGQRL